MLSGDPLVEQSCQAVVNENELSPSKTSLITSEDWEEILRHCEEMLPSEKTGEPLTLEEEASLSLGWERMLRLEKTEESWGGIPFSVPYQPWKNRTNRWYENEHQRVMEKMLFNLKHLICSSSEDPLVEQSFQAVVNENGHKFNMTEGEYNLWKDMPEKLKAVLIQIIPDKAEVVRRLRSEAREGKAKAASPASQELQIGGGPSTVNYAPESSDMEAGTSSTQADDEHAEHTNPETGGSSSTPQNEPPPNHRSLPVGGDHRVRNVQVNGAMNQTVNYASESSDIEAGPSSTQDVGVKWDKRSADGMTTIEKFFWDSLVVCIIVGIISLCYGLCLSDGDGRGRRRMVARVVNAVSYVATGLAVVTAGGLQFHNPKMVVWLIPLFWVIIVPAIVGYTWKQR
ncbi:uncharacterized protein LOC116146681 isoform X2 [Pistacia vera]|uniref:uncharacterized protein LOC116146681 isoform X2 n=1 Tax=Pistacia vera TaxID=55513 RepID=UPI0012631B15|nr:uncharacterized protein LOC116146681 isoform X2 [Pistacia vera]